MGESMGERMDKSGGEKKWECTNCGIRYGSEPNICPDCNESSFRVVEETPPEPVEIDESMLPSFSILDNWQYVLGILVTLSLGLFMFGTTLYNPTVCDSANTTVPQSSSVDRNYVECEMHEAINDRRTQRGLSKLSYTAGLRGAARDIAESVVRNNYTLSEARSRTNPRTYLRGTVCARNHGNSDTVIYWGTMYGEVFETPEGGTHLYDTNPELAHGTVEELLNNSRIRRALYEETYSNHGIGIAVSDSKVYIIEIMC
ncbi:MAG: hypothetical protein SXQ77_00075 [Halobacteria archaeon]|nr:hypothetical protein [Halobacteria archaeon]